MLVGKACSGKTSIYTIIQSAYLSLSKSEPSLYRPLEFTLINPKAVNTNGLYGYVNLLTNEWHDGIVSKIIRQTAQEERNARQIIVLDGPVDTLWAENLNTVLDDNRMLCLSNGQRIKLPSNIQFLFEVEDLNMASPATVSRCGMVYMD
jgi:dynein heavy chain, axonemal